MPDATDRSLVVRRHRSLDRAQRLAKEGVAADHMADHYLKQVGINPDSQPLTASLVRTAALHGWHSRSRRKL
jgi:hypothetical protein